MNLRTIGAALAAGVTAFLLVTVAVTAALAPRIEFSIFLGLPAGLLAGSLTAAVVLLQFGRGTDPTRRALATALAGFGVVFLAALVAGSTVLQVGTALAILGGVGLGTVGGVALFVWQRTRLRETAEAI